MEDCLDMISLSHHSYSLVDHNYINTTKRINTNEIAIPRETDATKEISQIYQKRY